MKKSITLSDIARESGVSRQVVSAILNPNSGGNIRYSRETYDRVILVANEMNYRPNRAAMSLVKNRHGALGMLINQTGAIPSRTLQHLLHLCKMHDLTISIESFSADDDQLPIFIREDCVDGIMLFENFTETLTDRIHILGIPSVYVNNNLTRSPDSITFDEQDAMDQAAELFVRKEKKNLLIILPEEETFPERGHYSIAARRKGIIKACAKLGIDPPQVFIQKGQFADPDYDSLGYEQYREYLSAHSEINAVVLYNDMQAPALFQAAYDLGKKIPHDMAVLGIHFSAAKTRVLPPLSVLQIDPELLARTIISTLENKRLGSYTRKKPLKLQYQLTENGST